MKKKFISTIAIASIVLGLLTGCGSSASKVEEAQGPTKIVCGTTTGYYPFVFSDEGEDIKGYDIELIKAVFDKLPQYELEFALNDWDAILTGLDSGLYQISTECIFYSEERAEKYLFSEPIFYDPVVAVTPSDYKDVHTFNDIAGESVPAGAGSIWAIAIEKYNNDYPDEQLNIDYAETDFFQVFSSAEAGNKILLTDYGMAAGITSEADFNVRVQPIDADFLDKYMDSSYTYFLMSKYGDASTQLQKDVNAALAEVIADGTASELSKKYFGDDFTTAKYPKK